MISVQNVNTCVIRIRSFMSIKFHSNQSMHKKTKRGNKAKYKYCNGLIHWGNPTCFSANFLKTEKISKWINLKNSKRSSEPPFKTAAVRNLEHLETHDRLFSLKLSYSIYISVIFRLLSWTHTKTKTRLVLPRSFREATDQIT